MHFKLFSVIALSLVMLVTGCSTVKKVVYRPDINQGNYLASADAARLAKGMSKEQVLFLLGSPMLTDPFGSDTWFYVFRQQPGHKGVTQQTLTLRFDGGGTLYDIIREEPYPARK